MKQLTPLESQIRELLDADFKEWLGEYRFYFFDRQSECGLTSQLAVFLDCSDGKNFKAESQPFEGSIEAFGSFCEYQKQGRQLIEMLWKAVAEAWLADSLADHGEQHRLGTNQKNPWTRSDRPLPSKLSDKELDIRHRLAFGGKK